MTKKQYHETKQKLISYAEEIRVRRGHLSRKEKEKLLEKAKKLWTNANIAA